MKALYSILIFSVIVLSSYHVVYSNDTKNEIDQYLDRHYGNKKFNGNVLITKGNEIIYSNSYGYANKQHKVQNTDSTKFLIGSITKPFTALGILILEEEGKLRLENKLSEYFPEFENSEKVTIKQLLTHTSGIPDYHSLSDWVIDSKSDNTTPEFTIEKVNGRKFDFEPGTNFRYSNTGYIFLGLIIEKVSGLKYSEFINKNILKPLGLNDTGIIDNKSIIPNLANGYTTTPRESIVADYINYNQPYASGNMYSTSKDLLNFTQAIMSSELISPEKTKEIFKAGKYYGYGWGIRNFDGIKAYGHYGGMNGFVGAITYIPDNDYFICILTNDDNTPKIRITSDLVSILYNNDVALPEETALIPLEKDIISQVVGKYKVKENHYFFITDKDGKLYLQEGNNDKHEMYPYDKYKFSFTLLEPNLVFSDVKKNKAHKLELVGSKTILTAVRVE
ncbi:MAG: serine hydrolase domain-containing protein [Chlorobiota bacterium]